MRESMGSAWIFSICMTFIVIFTAYLAISVNYAKAFRIKDHIVSYIEENEGYTAAADADIETYLTSQGYSAYGNCPMTIQTEGESTHWERKGCLGNAPAGSGMCGVCIYEMPINTGIDDIDADRKYYRAVAFFQFDLPIVNVFLQPFPISGESKYIYEDVN